LEAVTDVVVANPRLVDPDGAWDVLVTWVGHTYQSGQLRAQDGSSLGWAAGFDVRFQIEATRCS
jgi:hypothetical protein